MVLLLLFHIALGLKFAALPSAAQLGRLAVFLVVAPATAVGGKGVNQELNITSKSNLDHGEDLISVERSQSEEVNQKK